MKRGNFMISMQYNISLPSDYDMEIIKERVKQNGKKTDGFPDLNMKAYLIAEKSRFDNYENQYAPFYLWEKEDGMNQFLLGGPFNNIISSFGRPKVNNWVVLHQDINKSDEQQFAVVQIIPVPITSDLTKVWSDEKETFSKITADTATKAYITAYNPFTWEICRFYMSTDLAMIQKIAKDSLIYDVYHVS